MTPAWMDKPDGHADAWFGQGARLYVMDQARTSIVA